MSLAELVLTIPASLAAGAAFFMAITDAVIMLRTKEFVVGRKHFIRAMCWMIAVCLLLVLAFLPSSQALPATICFSVLAVISVLALWILLPVIDRAHAKRRTEQNSAE